MSIRTKNTSFSTDPETFRLAKTLAALEDISLSALIDRALRKEITLLIRKHKQNKELATLAFAEEEKSA